MGNVLLLDPSFTHSGWAVLGEDKKPKLSGCIETMRQKKLPKGKKRSEEDMSRARIIAAILKRVITKANITGVCLEVPTGSKSAAAAKGLGLVKGVMGTLLEIYDLENIYKTPQNVKDLVCGKIDASKDEIKAMVIEYWPDYNKIVGTTKAIQEHQYDALAVGMACLEDKETKSKVEAMLLKEN